MNIVYQIAPNLESLGAELIKCIGQTFRMLVISGSIAFVFGLFFGVLLIVTKSGGIMANPIVYKILDKIIDVIRSIPFIILMVLLIPVSRALVGTGSGVTGSYVALIAGTVPFFARQIESVLAEVDYGLVEASASMGFSPLENYFQRISEGKHPRHHARDDDHVRQPDRYHRHGRRHWRRRPWRLRDPLRLPDGLSGHDLGNRYHHPDLYQRDPGHRQFYHQKDHPLILALK